MLLGHAPQAVVDELKVFIKLEVLVHLQDCVDAVAFVSVGQLATQTKGTIDNITNDVPHTH